MLLGDNTCLNITAPTIVAGEKIVERVEREKHCVQSPLSEENQEHLTRNPCTEPLIKIQTLLHIILFELHHLFLGLYAWHYRC